jgi:DNA polymerase-3 subunit alpha
MQVCNSLAGFTITDGYIMIKAVGKKKQYLLDKFMVQFVAGGVKKGVPEEIMKEYWNRFVTPFANYGFNASHACCYAYISYQTAYLKANYPDEFACAFMNAFVRRAVTKSANDWGHVEMMEKDAQRTLNIKILPRTLTDCSLLYKVVKKKDPAKGVLQTEVKPTICCKGLGWEAAKNIAEHGPYASIEELAKKTDWKLVTSESVGALIDAGFMKGKAGQKKKDEIVAMFMKIRSGLKASRNRGINSDVSIFG